MIIEINDAMPQINKYTFWDNWGSSFSGAIVNNKPNVYYNVKMTGIYLHVVQYYHQCR